MTNFIPIFPLGLVVFPGEQLNLHIFEPRYKQLIQECKAADKPFGIPAVINNAMPEMGTLVRVKEISQQYENGEMDIKTEGLAVFKILELVKEIPEKLYSGAIVTYPLNVETGSAKRMKQILQSIRELHQKLNVTKDFGKPDEFLNSFDVAHHVGLGLEDEYRLLELTQELQRQEFLQRHLNTVLPIMEDMHLLKGKIKMNGHFKNMEGFDFS
jgi:Lon protease-like protein